nr:DUF6625 family protein [uncultured Microbacterium sp.]
MERNLSIDWLLFTDQPIQESENVIVKRLSLDDVRRRFSHLLGFDVALDRPYKLCDFKPAYGKLFAEELEMYDYWGYCDADVVYGDLEKQITMAIAANPDKIFRRGHLSLFRNSPDLNVLYSCPINGRPDYRAVFQDQRSYAFDEVGGMYERYETYGVQVYENDALFDINPDRYLLQANNASLSERFYLYVHGRIVVLDRDLHEIREARYIHLQKRLFDTSELTLSHSPVVGFAPDRLIFGDSIESVCRDIRSAERRLRSFSGWHRRYLARRWKGAIGRLSGLGGIRVGEAK